MEEKFICPKCGNRDPKYFGYLNGKVYCRSCITFRGDDVEYTARKTEQIDFKLNFELSDRQKEISKTTLENYKNGINTLIYAVTGAGKTEIVYETIAFVLSLGKTVGFAIPRKDVVIELLPRLQKAFDNKKVIAVYGGHHNELKGDIVLLTTHQLYRYKNYFDLLIVDEIDAFPYQNNELLESFFVKSIRHNYIYMSATPSNRIKELFKSEGYSMLTLFSRFHNHSLIVPKVKKISDTLQYLFVLKLLRNYHKLKKRVLIFVPTIGMSKKVFDFLKLFFKNINYVNSKRENKDQILNDFRDKKIMFIVTTSILERGITIDDLQVVVLFSNHIVYSSQSLIQIAGRVGRNINHPSGDVYFLTNEITENIKDAIKEINYCNSNM
ncbi:MAG: DEAD/DEAH box helicase family protein [Erysipelotrichales bacterium]|nr:DEAD/DEAH box helicase family protein [Erysipelotrichales bacterium]